MTIRNTLFALTVFSFFIAAYPGPAASQPMFEVKTDKPTYTMGPGMMRASVRVENPGAAMVVDVHMGIIDPSGDIYEYPNWNTNLEPTLEDFPLPGNMGPTSIQLFTQNIAGTAPFSDGPGTYLFAIALMEPNTHNIIGNPAVTYFNVQSSDSATERFGGMFLTDITDYTGDTARTDVYAAGTFMERSDQVIDMDLEIPSLDLDSCTVFTWKTNSMGMFMNLPDFLDAGDELSMSGYTMIMMGQNGGPMAYMYDSMTAADYVGNRNYTFSGPGGSDVGPFSTQVTAPPRITLMQPDLTTPTTIDRNTGMELRWQGQPGNDAEIWVSILASEFSSETLETTNYECQCRFRDDGQATIPADILRDMPSTDLDFGGMMPRHGMGFGGGNRMDVFRTNWTPFEARGIDYGFGAISTGIAGNVELR